MKDVPGFPNDYFSGKKTVFPESFTIFLEQTLVKELAKLDWQVSRGMRKVSSNELMFN